MHLMDDAQLSRLDVRAVGRNAVAHHEQALNRVFGPVLVPTLMRFRRQTPHHMQSMLDETMANTSLQIVDFPLPHARELRLSNVP